MILLGETAFQLCCLSTTLERVPAAHVSQEIPLHGLGFFCFRHFPGALRARVPLFFTVGS